MDFFTLGVFFSLFTQKYLMSGGQPAYSQRHFVKRGGGTWLKLRSFVNAMVKLHGSKVIKHRKKEGRFSSKCFDFIVFYQSHCHF